MSDPLHHQLLGHLLGALDDDEQQGVDARLEHDGECCRELVQWRQRLAPLEALRPEYEPPPGLTERTCRYVAACVAALLDSQQGRLRWRMSPVPVPPSRTEHVGWMDVITISLLLAMAVALLFPAIQGSRFEARVASCQDGLHQFGLALNQYSESQHDFVSRLARHGALTHAGVFAAGCLQDAYPTDSHREVCPQAWLAAQGVLWCPARQAACARRVAAAVPESFCDEDDWPGMWCDGTMDGWQLPPSPAEMPLLADAPSADLPGQDLASHGGRGRNVLFEDGRVDFLPVTGPANAVDMLLSAGGDSSLAYGSLPIVFVSRH